MPDTRHDAATALLPASSSKAKQDDSDDEMNGHSGGHLRGALAYNSMLGRWFYKQGKFCAHYPKVTMLVALLLVAWACLGLLYVNVVTSPQKIWVPPNSPTNLQQNYFNAMFDPFFRTEVIIVTTPTEDINMVTQPYLLRLLDLQTSITDSKDSHGHNLNDLCYKPIVGKGCIIESPLNYWRSNRTALQESTLEDIQATTACVSTNGKIPCMSKIGVPVMRDVVLGGITCNETAKNPDPCGGCIPSATALVLTFLLDNTAEVAEQARVWEHDVFLAEVEAIKEEWASDPEYPMTVTYMAQRSIQDELGREDSRNAFVVVASYIAMFLYISLALGKFPHPIRSRSLLGLQGIIIVASSVLAAIGICSFFGSKITMIVTEVVPFLILAIGVDNMFIIAKAFDREQARDPNQAVDELLGRTLAEVGPSITAAAFGEFLAFAVGATTKIPALEQFCLVAAVAVLLDYFLQITWFVAGVSMDARRMKSNRADMGVCVKLNPNVATKGPFWRGVMKGDYVRTLIDKYFSKVLFTPVCKVIVLVMWAGLLAVSCFAATKMELGLPQQLAVPTDSYLIPFFDVQQELMEAGPPAYIVLQNVNYTDPAMPAEVQKVEQGLSELKQWIDPPVYSWISAYEAWFQSRDFINNQLCIPPHPGAKKACDCPVILGPEHPLPERVAQFLNVSIDSTCCQDAGYCGAQFAQDVRLGNDKNGTLQIIASRMRTQHTALRNQSDYIHAMLSTQAVVDVYSGGIPTSAPVDIANPPATAPGGAAFVYSLFYVYYAQYSYIQGVAIQNVLLALGAVFMATLCVSRLSTAAVVTALVASIAVDIVGFVWALNPKSGSAASGEFGVSINAVSVVNLVMAVGLSVEFCVHIANAFATKTGTREERAKSALSEMGSSVVTGITLTKFCGVLVLAWAPSRLFRLYYFRMYLGIIVMGAFHGLAVLPVVLSLIGPPNPGTGGSRSSSNARRHGRGAESYGALSDDEPNEHAVPLADPVVRGVALNGDGSYVPMSTGAMDDSE